METAQTHCHVLSRYYRNAIRYLICHNIKWQFTFQDPFGEERGTFQYRNILTRLQALHAKLSAKCNNIRALGDKTTSDECSSDDSELDQPGEQPGLESS
jgi:type II secretory pathway component PulM